MFFGVLVHRGDSHRSDRSLDTVEPVVLEPQEPPEEVGEVSL